MSETKRTTVRDEFTRITDDIQAALKKRDRRIENAAFERAAAKMDELKWHEAATVIRKLKTDDITERDIAETMPPKPEEA